MADREDRALSRPPRPAPVSKPDRWCESIAGLCAAHFLYPRHVAFVLVRTQMPPRVVRARKSGLQPTCFCGWEGPSYGSADEALMGLKAHQDFTHQLVPRFSTEKILVGDASVRVLLVTAAELFEPQEDCW